jgi:hypothetical protein
LIGFNITSPTTPAANYRAVYASNTSPFALGGTANLNLVDGQIQVNGSTGKAIYNYDQDTYIDGVYFKANTIIDSGILNTPTESVAGSSSAWKKLGYYVFASMTDNAYVNVDGAELHNSGTPDDYVSNYTLISASPPADLISRHLYGTMPSWQDSNITNITSFGATPDDNSDDDASAIQSAIDYAIANNKVVFVPRGHYHIKSPILLKDGTKLIGAGKNISAIQVDRSWLPTTAKIAIDTVDSATASVTLQDLAFVIEDPSVSLGLENQKNITLLRVQSGNTIMRSVQTDRAGGIHTTSTGLSNSYDCVYLQPTLEFSNNAGGKIYGIAMDHTTFIQKSGQPVTGSIDPSFRQVKFENVSNPLTIYQMSVEHGAASPQIEAKNSSNLTIFGLKMEFNYEFSRINNSSSIHIIGGSGIYNIDDANSAGIYNIVGAASDILIVNGIDQDILTTLINNGPGAYNISLWARNGSGTGDISIKLKYTDNGTTYFKNVGTVTGVGTAWTKVSGIENISWTNLTSAELYTYNSNATATMYVDDFSMTK